MISSVPSSRNIIITGVTRGLGRSLAEEFIRQGHYVMGCARTQSHIDELKKTYPAHNFQKVDVASAKQVARWASRLLNERVPDLILNNAAIFNRRHPLGETSKGEFSALLETNVIGVFNVFRTFAQAMILGGRGVIINFCSRWATTCQPLMGPYCATKAAVLSLTRVMALELKGTGVAAVAFNPGVVRTQMLRQYLNSYTGAAHPQYIEPKKWATIAAPFILKFGLKDAGKLRRLPRNLKQSGG